MIKNVIAFMVLLGLATAFTTLMLGYTPDEALNLTARYYAENTASDTGAQNIVTAIIVTYRGLDTLGEVTVLFLTAATVALVLRKERLPGQVPVIGLISNLLPSGELLLTGCRLLVPLIILFGIYVFVNGHLTPGGGFQGGAIVASGILLMLLTHPFRRFSHALIARIESGSGFLYVTIGILGLFLAGGFLDNRILPLGTFGSLFSAGAIPLIYSLIGLKVGAEFSSMMVSFAETEDK
ncbi:Na(+)/H(+) antiporter subunit B [Magnetospira sp. QH-2]|uniref:Na(+)/H(+) antiporter subunit B n=1 Tax=Magnetospira sp. (strain QH-2) TaxID=1288970 RepID=UPI0003E81442|nr:Na(+)/H(+) antiporter subunit B [Magnetospira sp. QH-2]CCQ75308.1 putative Na+/H+ antiporter, MnhB subunit [Magnetospira sp. QH-2]